MKPLLAGRSVSRSLLRSFPAFFIFINNENLNTIKSWDFENVNYLSLLGIAVFSVLLIIGGFFSKQVLTIVSGFFLMLLGIIMLVLNYGEPSVMSFSVIISIIGLFFVTNGNNKTTN